MAHLEKGPQLVVALAFPRVGTPWARLVNELRARVALVAEVVAEVLAEALAEASRWQRRRQRWQ